MRGGGHKQAIELILDYQLPVIIVSGALAFSGDSLGEICILVGDGMNLEMIHPLGRFEQKPTALIETKYRCPQSAFAHLLKSMFTFSRAAKDTQPAQLFP